MQSFVKFDSEESKEKSKEETATEKGDKEEKDVREATRKELEKLAKKYQENNAQG